MFSIRDHDDSDFRPPCLLKKEQLVLFKDVDDLIGNEVVLYNLEEGSFDNFIFYGILDDFCVGEAFLETLISPNAAGL